MPLPPPPGYCRGRQLRVDRRRIALAGVLYGFAVAVLVGLAHRAARAPGQVFQPIPTRYVLLVVGVAGFCGAWGETMHQLSLTRRGPGRRGNSETDPPIR